MLALTSSQKPGLVNEGSRLTRLKRQEVMSELSLESILKFIHDFLRYLELKLDNQSSVSIQTPDILGAGGTKQNPGCCTD